MQINEEGNNLGGCNGQEEMSDNIVDDEIPCENVSRRTMEDRIVMFSGFSPRLFLCRLCF